MTQIRELYLTAAATAARLLAARRWPPRGTGRARWRS